jgi:very-short-patch-repair endonuclease
MTLHPVLDGKTTEGALGQDYAQTRRVIKEKGRSSTRFLYRDWWRSRKRVIRLCKKGQRPKNRAETVRLLDDLCEYRELRASLTNRDGLGVKAFGRQWKGLQSDWQLLQTVALWVPGVIDLVKTNSVLKKCDEINAEDLTRLQKGIQHFAQGISAALPKWVELLEYDYVEAFGKVCDSVPLQTLIGKLGAARTRIEAVYEWIEYRKSRDTCRELEMAPLAALFDQGGIEPNRLVPQYEYSSAGEILRAALTSRPALGQFSGETHEHVIGKFRALDKRLIEATRQYLAAKLWDKMPHPTIGESDASPMNYLVSTLRRRRGIPPIRQLMERAGDVITQIKPCFMMSPMSIAQFLPPNTVRFDVLVFDEASQVKPEDALGALARCEQCVVVGDSKQLPPTSFFDRLSEGDGEEDSIGDVESILEAAALPIGGIHGGRMLRWHYRSKHESLIAFSNKEFYESKLHVFPSPNHECAELGLVGHYVENGVYARSGSRKNLVEAEAVARAVMEHATSCGDLSLGVVALSRQQQEAITDKLEELRRENPEREWFFNADTYEPFFVKNLENVQGDERDVIFISIGYGRDPQGYFRMNFGPVNREGGWRRLNVLVTRAKRRCEVFYSIRADEIRVTDLSDAERYSLRGRVALRNYLEYVRTGQLEQPGMPGEDVESPFEAAVAEALRQHGVETVRQVGIAGFRIDLGVVDPGSPGRYLLGVECDGATYHSARSARDRDRLRQEVLESLGWKIHRVWSLDWLKDREKEMRRLLLAIEAAKSNRAGVAGSENAPPRSEKGTVIKRTSLQKEAKHPHELVSKPYVRYTRRRLSGHPSDMKSGRLADLIAEIVTVESPIHVDELVRRVAEAFGLQRTGSRIQDAVLLAIRSAERLEKISCKKSFVWEPKMKKPSVRSRIDMDIVIERIAPEEIQVAAEKVNEVAHGLTTDALVTEVARSLGYLRVSINIDQYIRSALRLER